MAMRRGGMLAMRTLRQSGQRVPVAGSSLRMMSTHVSVIGLHWKTDETRLREVFSGYGTLEEAKLLTPDHSSTHLWASLVYATFEEALEAASEMNGQELDGRLLRVSIVDPPTEGGPLAATTK
ncbi:Glycine-rich RNA-binding protein 2, mitochondrial [Phytophthora cinnamomi]|nr:Glycine-rich RNA-binding protein 2, mitochondrial [Phytophthora cinnamomi]